jgi:hypothetical protein
VKEEQQEVQNMTTTVPWFTFSSLQAGTPYKIFIYSVNAKGSNEPFPVDVVTQGKRMSAFDTNVEIPAGEYIYIRVAFPFYGTFSSAQSNEKITFYFMCALSEKQQRNFHVTTAMGVIIAVISVLFVMCLVASAFKMQCCKSMSNSKRSKVRTSNGNLHVSESDKTFPSPIHDEDGAGAVCTSMEYSMDADDKNPDIIPQPIGGLILTFEVYCIGL